MNMPTKTNISTTWYHSLLRISVLLFATILIFASGIFNSSTQIITRTTTQQFASVIQTTTNQVIENNKEELSIQAEDIRETKITNTSLQSIDKSIFLLSVVVFILLLLIILNYILDYLRSKEYHNRHFLVMQNHN